MKVHDVEISHIIVPERLRKEMGDVDGLAKDIEKLGQLVPILITKDMYLIAGERRLRAMKKLGKTFIKALYMENLDELKKLEVEVSENIHRKQFTWQEEQDAIVALHNLRVSQRGEPKRGPGGVEGQSLERTAQELGVSRETVRQAIHLADARKKMPELNSAKSVSEAQKMIKKAVTQKLLKEAAKRAEKGVVGKQVENFVNGDCLEVMKTLPSGMFSFCITDPPWGVDLGNVKNKEIEFDDSFDSLEKLLPKAAKEIYRLLKEDSWLVMFFPMVHYSFFKETLEIVGFDVDPVPMIWDREVPMKNPAPHMHLSRSYEAMLLCRKGSATIVKQGQRNVFNIPTVATTQLIHSSQKPVGLLQELIEILTPAGAYGFDPFAGSGAFGCACLITKRRYLLIEKSPEVYAEALQNVQETADLMGGLVKGLGEVPTIDEEDLFTDDEKEFLF